MNLVLNALLGFIFLSVDGLYPSYTASYDRLAKASTHYTANNSQNGAIPCPNQTKKINFSIQSTEFSGEGYFFINFNKEEAFMPNAAFQQLMKGTKGMQQITLDQFMRNSKIESYFISGGKKVKVNTAIGSDMRATPMDALQASQFKKVFKKSGKTRKHLNTSLMEAEYLGKDAEQKEIRIWLVPASDVCLKNGMFSAWGFYNLGYIAIDGKTYLMTELTGPGFNVKIKGISNSNYQFSTAGYQSL